MKITTMLVIGFCLGLNACDGGPAPDGGVANYDALRAAQQKCAAQGGKLKLVKNGDSEYIGDYACEKG